MVLQKKYRFVFVHERTSYILAHSICDENSLPRKNVVHSVNEGYLTFAGIVAMCQIHVDEQKSAISEMSKLFDCVRRLQAYIVIKQLHIDFCSHLYLERLDIHMEKTHPKLSGRSTGALYMKGTVSTILVHKVQFAN